MAERQQLILSATERDRPGLVAELSGFIASRGCNVDDSRVVVLGGYAGLLFLISGDAAGIAAVEQGLPALERETGLRAVARRIEERGAEGGEGARQPTPTYVVLASAIDHEGLIHLITDTVRAHGGNILELETSTESAPMSGSPLFALRMVVALAEHLATPAKLREALDALARAEALDLEMTPAADAPRARGGAPAGAS